jgi:large subunit ribosomal protein L29
MRAADLREKSVDDLRDLKKTLAREVFQNRLKNFTNRLDDTSAMRKARRDLARVATLLHERDPGLQGKAAPATSAAPVSAPVEKVKPAAEKAAPVEVAPPAAPQAKPEKTAKKKSSAKAKQGSEAK